jgi:hypothetical protein
MARDRRATQPLGYARHNLNLMTSDAGTPDRTARHPQHPAAQDPRLEDPGRSVQRATTLS